VSAIVETESLLIYMQEYNEEITTWLQHVKFFVITMPFFV